jgi:hypothetical protein
MSMMRPLNISGAQFIDFMCAPSTMQHHIGV